MIEEKKSTGDMVPKEFKRNKKFFFVVGDG